MKERWKRLCSLWFNDDKTIETLYLILEGFYQPRCYHNLSHIESMLMHFDEYHHMATRPFLVEFAIWLHDIATDEEQSADLAKVFLRVLAAKADETAEICKLILATKHSSPSTIPRGQLIADLDLLILASKPGDYDRYADSVRMEYITEHDISYLQFLRGRKKFLEEFMQRPVIFQTTALREKFESDARSNMQRELVMCSAMIQSAMIQVGEDHGQ